MEKKFIVGYNLSNRSQFTKAIEEFNSHIKTVYSALPMIPNGRANIPKSEFQTIIQDLTYYSSLNVQINLLLNATCFGSSLIDSNEFYSIIFNTIKTMIFKNINVTSITCTNSYIVNFIKKQFPNLKIICSINSDYYFIQQFNQVKQLYDGFYINKSYNRNLTKIQEFHNWAKQNNKQLFCLINSGCLRYCAELIQHMNITSHFQKFKPHIRFKQLLCSKTFSDNPYKILSESTFYRPQDFHLIQHYFDGLKLATRSNPKPYEIIKAYVNNSYNDNICNILQPSHELNVPNNLIPTDWIFKITSCFHNCSTCKYCESLFNKIKN